MSNTSLTSAPILIIGAGIMGSGIAQVAAQAGHTVYLHDARQGAAAQAIDKLASSLSALVAKGKLTAEHVASALARIIPADNIGDASAAMLVVEAIAENLDAKRQLLRQLEEIVSRDCILATNTSSISVTALANGLKYPDRLVGMHFFNPVPVMKLVEIVSGLNTASSVAETIFELSRVWGKTPVYASSTPGFIVNRLARPFYAETLALLSEKAALPEVLDACVRGAGFRMGPCELMDLIGHDTNFAVTQSVYEANFFDKRFVPSGVQRDLVDGGLLGRKTGRGFFIYPEGAPPLPVEYYSDPDQSKVVTVHGDDAMADKLAFTVSASAGVGDARLVRKRDSRWTGISMDGAHLVLTDGRSAMQLAKVLGSADIVVFDRPMQFPIATGTSIAYSVAPSTSDRWREQAVAWLSHLGFQPHRIIDSPGLVVARTVAMLINEAADAVQQGACTADSANSAMRLGVNYPAGPFDWLEDWSVRGVIDVLEALDSQYRGERYRVSPWLRRRDL